MGQYQQWLHYQEIDRHLRSQLETLEARLVQLQDRLQLLEQEQQEQLAFLADNPIIQALAARLNSHEISPKVLPKTQGGAVSRAWSIDFACAFSLGWATKFRAARDRGIRPRRREAITAG